MKQKIKNKHLKPQSIQNLLPNCHHLEDLMPKQIVILIKGFSSLFQITMNEADANYKQASVISSEVFCSDLSGKLEYGVSDSEKSLVGVG